MRLSSKLRLASDGRGNRTLLYYCEGCEEFHGVPIERDGKEGPLWTWDGEIHLPTISPSVNVRANGPRRCHHSITLGYIVYHGDTQHSLRSLTCELADLPGFSAP